jgi:hypothetical protein
MERQASQPPASRSLWMRLVVVLLRWLPYLLIVGFWTGAIFIRQVPLAVLVGAITTSLLYLLVWLLRMVLSHRARLAFKNGGSPLWTGGLVVLLLWAGWLFLLTPQPLHTIFQGLAVLASLFFGLGAFAAYVTDPREGEELHLDWGGPEGCLECLFFFG